MIVKTPQTAFLSGLDQVFSNLNKELQKIEGRSQEGLVLAALEIRTDAQKLTPVVTGNLRNSAYVASSKGQKSSPSFKGKEAGVLSANHQQRTAQSVVECKTSPAIEVHVGFTAVYAPFVHENPRAGKTGGYSPKGKVYKPEKGSSRIVWSRVGQWKFLEDAVKQNMKKILTIVAAKARIK